MDGSWVHDGVVSLFCRKKQDGRFGRFPWTREAMDSRVRLLRSSTKITEHILASLPTQQTADGLWARRQALTRSQREGCSRLTTRRPAAAESGRDWNLRPAL